MAAVNDQLSVEAAVQACYSTWATSYFDEYYGPDAPYPAVHADLVCRLLAEAGARTVLDAGCGPASMLRLLLAQGYDAYGFDLSAEMVAEAKRVVVELGRPEESIWRGSVLDHESYGQRAGDFDTAISVGVLPHLPPEADVTALRRLHDAVRPGGLVVVEARNALFALFTLNRYTHELFTGELIPASVAAAAPRLSEQFRMDLPPVRRGRAGEPGYDEVLSRVHNPFVLADHAQAAGLRDVRVAFYHFHALPPMLVTTDNAAAVRAASLAMEANPFDWRGHVMASAFFVIGRRP